MYENRINLTTQDILSKEFKIDTRGYRLKEVDGFLDEIIKDYNEFMAIIDEQNKEKEELLNEIMRLKQELRNVKTSIEIAKSGESEVTNIDIMRRLSQLEKIVYAHEMKGSKVVTEEDQEVKEEKEEKKKKEKEDK